MLAGTHDLILPSTDSRYSAMKIFMPTTILFDLDGTLVDTMPSFANIAAQVMSMHASLDFGHARDLYLKTSGLPFEAQLDLIVPKHSKKKAMVDTFEKRKLHFSTRAKLAPSTVEVLHHLRASGIQIGISSNSYQEQVTNFAASSPVPFDFALGFSQELSKGHSHISWLEKRGFGDRKHMLFVGDSLSDAKTAQSSGISFIAVTTTFSRDAFESEISDITCISDITGLIDLICAPSTLSGGHVHDCPAAP